MITTGEQLSTFITSLNTEATIDPTLLDVLVDNARSILEEERPWMVLRKTDTSKTVTTANTWQTAIDLSTITDLSRFYGEYSITLFDGSNRRHHFRQVPWDRRLEYKDDGNTFVYNHNTKTLYLNGTLPFSGTLYINYIATSTAVDLTSGSAVWTLFPPRFLPVLGYYAIGIYKGAVDYDSINREMLGTNFDTLKALKNAMEKWDNELQANEIQYNDPTELYGNTRLGTVNRYDS